MIDVDPSAQIATMRSSSVASGGSTIFCANSGPPSPVNMVRKAWEDGKESESEDEMATSDDG